MWQWDGFQHLSTCCQARVGSCGHVPSCQALNVVASRGSGVGNSYPLPKAPGCPSPALGLGGRRDGQTGGEILSAPANRKEKE
jgi:hypothetical protein